MKMSKLGRYGAAVLVVLVGLFATIGEGSTSDSGNDSGNKAPNAESTVAGGDTTKLGADAAPSQEGADKAKPIPVGTQIKVSSGWEFKVNSAVLNATDQMKQANEYVNTPDAGKQFVLVNVSMINKSGKPDAPLTNLKTSLLPPSGVAIDSEFVVDVDEACDVTTQLQPDAVYTCNLVFQAKTDEADKSLLLVEPQFTLDQNDAQRFFNLQ